MLSFSGSLKIFVLVEPCDMRKGFNGLYGMVSPSFGEDPRSGALFVFSNRRHTRIKILYWDGSGLWVLTKRLERGSRSRTKPGLAIRRSEAEHVEATRSPESLVRSQVSGWLAGPRDLM